MDRHTDMAQDTRGVLNGIKVVEFAQNIAVPFCGRMLAAMGADVVKVEPPEGDAMRHLDRLPAEHESRQYAAINAGKRGIVLDLGKAASRPAVEALIRWADVVLTGMKRPDLERYAIDYARVATLNPSVVYLENSAFGAKGPDADQGGYDVLAQALSGLSFLSARDDGNAPEPIVPAYTDHATAMCSTIAVLGALRHRDASGEGQRVTTSLLGSAMSLELPFMTRFESVDPPMEAEFAGRLAEMRARRAPPREQRLAYQAFFKRNAGLTELYYRNFQTADGLIAVGAISPALRTRFHEVTGVTDPRVEGLMPGDPKWLDIKARAEAAFAERSTDAWLSLLRAARVPCVRHQLPFETLDDPQVRLNDMLVELEHPTLGRYTTANVPFGFDRTPATVSGPSPRLGADTDAVLGEIGLDADAIGALRSGGALG
jgi:crotonobetainyl-CoA:carnitine CoA-transferase CaiB-like acyl-CoA transferase